MIEEACLHTLTNTSAHMKQLLRFRKTNIILQNTHVCNWKVGPLVIDSLFYGFQEIFLVFQYHQTSRVNMYL